MTQCKYCEKITQGKDFCNENCMCLYDHFRMRKIVVQFSQDMERIMQEKDKLGYENKSREIKYLEDKLHEERNEVDECFINNDIKKFVNEESLHEGIILALLRNRLKEDMK